MYFPLWMLLVMITLWISVAAFIWGLKTGQFADPQRARYLPFTDGQAFGSEVEAPGKLPWTMYVYAGLITIGIGAFLITIGLVLYHQFTG